jgi:hypothetical protein
LTLKVKAVYSFIIVEYIGKLNFNIFCSIGYPPLYCHLIQTGGIELLSVVSETKFSVTKSLSPSQWLESSVGYAGSPLNGIS